MSLSVNNVMEGLSVARLYFTSIDSNSRYNVVTTDGTAAGTIALTVSGGTFNGSDAIGFTTVGSKVFFAAYGANSKNNLYVIDPATNIITQIVAPTLTSVIGLTGGMIAFKGKLYFGATDSSGAVNLFTSDGTAAGTTVLPIPGQQPNYFYPGHFAVFGNKLAFIGEGGPGASSQFSPFTQLFVSDGTSAGTTQLNFPGLVPLGFQIQSMVGVGNRLFFSGFSSSTSNAIYVTDGTAAGTTRLAPVGLNSTGGANDVPAALIAFGSKVAFTATDNSGNVGIWVSDGTIAGTIELPNLVGNTYGVPMVALPGGRLAIIATRNGATGIFITNGTAANLTALQVPGANAAGLSPHAIMALGNKILFDGLNTSSARVLFISDGTSTGTSQLATGINLPAGNIDTNAASTIILPAIAQATTLPIVTAATAAVLGTATPSAAGDTLSVSLVSDKVFATGSSVAIDGAGRITYRPGAITTSGADNISYRVTDATTGLTVDADATLTLAVSPTIAAASSLPTLKTGGSAVLGAVTPSNPGDTLSVTLLADTIFPSASSISIDGSGQLTYRPGTIGTSGTDAITYRVTDATSGLTVDGAASLTLKKTNPAVGFVNSTSGASGIAELDDATADGPSYLQNKYIYAGTDNIAFSTQAPNVFIHSGSGMDAIQVTSGQNVLDGGLGSNFETGGTGTDTFFTDARSPGIVWNTVRNFHIGDAATLWGFTAGVSSYRWEADIAGAAGFEGATLRANIVGGAGRNGDGIDASITFTGLSVSQAKALQIVTGTQQAGDYLYIYNPGV